MKRYLFISPLMLVLLGTVGFAYATGGNTIPGVSPPGEGENPFSSGDVWVYTAATGQLCKQGSDPPFCMNVGDVPCTPSATKICQ